MIERSAERRVRQETGWLTGGPLLRVPTIRRTTDTFLFISHTTNVLLFKFRYNIVISVRIIKEMPGLVGSGTPRINYIVVFILYLRVKTLKTRGVIVVQVVTARSALRLCGYF
jgi:hypothetical protein